MHKRALACLLLCAAIALNFASVECRLTNDEMAELHSRRQAHHSSLHHQVHHSSAVNFKNLTEFVQVIDPPDDLDWRRPEESIRSEQETFHPFVAFRSPINSSQSVVKVFLLAEMFIIDDLDCGFSRHGQPADAPEIIEPAKVQYVGMLQRRYSDYMLTCSDPGPEYTTFTFVREKMALKSIPITTTEPSQGGVGVCVGGLYSGREDFGRWVTDTLEAGFSAIYVYYTHLDPAGRDEDNWFYGTMPVEANNEMFQPYWHDQVHYIYYDSPSHSFDVAQLLVYNLCVQQNNPKHDFMGIFDPDEFFWRAPSQEPLSDFLSGLVGDKAAAAKFDRLHFPRVCQVEPFVGAKSKLHWPEVNMDKTIVMTNRTQVVGVHQLILPEGAYEKYVTVPTSTAYWKHVRHEEVGCGGLLDNETLSAAS